MEGGPGSEGQGGGGAPQGQKPEVLQQAKLLCPLCGQKRQFVNCPFRHYEEPEWEKPFLLTCGPEEECRWWCLNCREGDHPTSCCPGQKPSRPSWGSGREAPMCPVSGGEKPECPKPEREEPERPRPEREEPERPRPEREEPERPRPEREEPERPRPEREEPERPRPEREEPERPRPEREESVRPRPEREESVRLRPEREESVRPLSEKGKLTGPGPKGPAEE
ncbi:UNVERIFIED_CONTAM: hypothetical protein FKN15_035478 [Acipenser sinensis]